jgi:Flp pilus assembly protein TadG
MTAMATCARRLFPRIFSGRRFTQNEDGTALLEFAFTFPILLTAVIGALEVMGLLFATALMEGGLREASRFGITGLEPAGKSRQEMIVDLVNRSGVGLVTVTLADVKTTVYSNFENIGQPEPYVDDTPANGTYDLGESYVDINGNGQWDLDMGAAGVGNAGDVVVYSLDYQWPLLTPLMAPFMGSDGKVTLQASVAVRNEPYDVAPPPLP